MQEERQKKEKNERGERKKWKIINKKMSSPLKRSHVLERHRRLRIHIIYIGHVSFVRFNVRAQPSDRYIFLPLITLFDDIFFLCSFSCYSIHIHSSIMRAAPAGHLLCCSFARCVNFLRRRRKSSHWWWWKTICATHMGTYRCMLHMKTSKNVMQSAQRSHQVIHIRSLKYEFLITGYFGAFNEPVLVLIKIVYRVLFTLCLCMSIYCQ